MTTENNLNVESELEFLLGLGRCPTLFVISGFEADVPNI
jgi:hypothetical protein